MCILEGNSYYFTYNTTIYPFQPPQIWPELVHEIHQGHLRGAVDGWAEKLGFFVQPFINGITHSGFTNQGY